MARSALRERTRFARDFLTWATVATVKLSLSPGHANTPQSTDNALYGTRLKIRLAQRLLLFLSTKAGRGNLSQYRLPGHSDSAGEDAGREVSWEKNVEPLAPNSSVMPLLG
uniref:Uncharacterized protein n=1 Tax=mine drainage metagenome TaxID=410659 RepID=E6PEQ4_9ZZZZ